MTEDEQDPVSDVHQMCNCSRIWAKMDALRCAGIPFTSCKWKNTFETSAYPRIFSQSAELKSYTVNGAEKGTLKQVDNLSYMQVFGAGHQLPYYERELALQVFKQMMETGKLVST